MPYIINGARTAFTEFGGSFKDLSEAEIGRIVTEGAINKSNIQKEDIDEVIFGNVTQTGDNSAYLARHITLKAGLAEKTPAFGLNRLCGSGLQSIVSAAESILTNSNNVVVAGGVENMSAAPHLLKGSRFGSPNKAPIIEDMLWGTLVDKYIGFGMGVTAENLAEKYNISRSEQDEFAITSHKRANEARNSGRFAEEIVPVIIRGRKEITIDQDQHIRAEIDFEKLSSLKPAFKKEGSVTAGNASGINDGAAAVVVASEEYIVQNNIEPLAKIVSWSSVGVDPSIMGIGPVPAIEKALEKAQLNLSDIDLFEINEAFSAQTLAVMKELNLDPEKTNVNGGAIALGHPLGASGTRITYSLALELKRRNLKYGVASLCIGGGQGIAVILENVTVKN